MPILSSRRREIIQAFPNITHINVKWSNNELLTMCIQEERRLTMEKSESVFVAPKRKNMNQAKPKGKDKILPQGGVNKEYKCFFCKRKGHVKKDCPSF